MKTHPIHITRAAVSARSTKPLSCDHCGRKVTVCEQAVRCLCWECAPKHRLSRTEQDEMLLTSAAAA
jgi:hypothetical protein